MQEYLIDFDLDEIEKMYYDVIIIGSGIAGIYTALESPPLCNIAILTKEKAEISNSVLAQGGIAVSLDRNDSPEFHFKDTLYAGSGLCEPESVWILVNEAEQNIKTLFKYGVNFDRKNEKELYLSKEGAHSKNRIIHAGDTTGKEVCDKLTAVAQTRKNISMHEKIFAIDFIVIDGAVHGVVVFDEKTEHYKAYMSNIVVCATGGYGQMYQYTTNPEVATGDGVSMAYRAGAELMDLEFVQFHPTVLYHPDNKSFLITEAVRGEGAVLRNVHGDLFMEAYHPRKELAARDVVSRAIFMEMQKTNAAHVYLDITMKEEDFVRNRFPNIYRTCAEYGIDITKEYIPVAPAVHYCMGGIRTDMHGRTNIKGLYACGEAACNGIHGANRLASNSLLEGLVFGRKIGDEITMLLEKQQMQQPQQMQQTQQTQQLLQAQQMQQPQQMQQTQQTQQMLQEQQMQQPQQTQQSQQMLQVKKQDSAPQVYLSVETGRKEKEVDCQKIKNEIKQLMTYYVGMIRNADDLQYALQQIDIYYEMVRDWKPVKMEQVVLINLVELAREMIRSCIAREESRGGHYREDFPETLDEWKRNIIVKREK